MKYDENIAPRLPHGDGSGQNLRAQITHVPIMRAIHMNVYVNEGVNICAFNKIVFE